MCWPTSDKAPVQELAGRDNTDLVLILWITTAGRVDEEPSPAANFPSGGRGIRTHETLWLNVQRFSRPPVVPRLTCRLAGLTGTGGTDGAPVTRLGAPRRHQQLLLDIGHQRTCSDATRSSDGAPSRDAAADGADGKAAWGATWVEPLTRAVSRGSDTETTERLSAVEAAVSRGASGAATDLGNEARARARAGPRPPAEAASWLPHRTCPATRPPGSAIGPGGRHLRTTRRRGVSSRSHDCDARSSLGPAEPLPEGSGLHGVGCCRQPARGDQVVGEGPDLDVALAWSTLGGMSEWSEPLPWFSAT